MMLYEWELANGFATEVARDNLPVSTYTSFWATANFVNWVRFLRLRNGQMGAPQWEIVQVAQQVQQIVIEHFPRSSRFWRLTD